MKEDQLNFLKEMPKSTYTHWLIGYIAGYIESPIKDGLVPLDEATLRKIPELASSVYKNVLLTHDYFGVNNNHYEIFAQMDEFETEVGLFYIQDGEVVASPFVFKLDAIQKSNLN